MEPLSFCYWLTGFTELTDGAHPTPEQWKMIKEHLDLVFTKVTPPLATPKSEPTYCAHGGYGFGKFNFEQPKSEIFGIGAHTC